MLPIHRNTHCSPQPALPPIGHLLHIIVTVVLSSSASSQLISHNVCQCPSKTSLTLLCPISRHSQPEHVPHTPTSNRHSSTYRSRRAHSFSFSSSQCTYHHIQFNHPSFESFTSFYLQIEHTARRWSYHTTPCHIVDVPVLRPIARCRSYPRLSLMHVCAQFRLSSPLLSSLVNFAPCPSPTYIHIFCSSPGRLSLVLSLSYSEDGSFVA
ncbi:hypothetical protein BDN70DRAFT_297958 [Pholiota conissans]|uniref:Uncharacterized protein n=1 Tax=Pholiota conissans TaxID=109636 RepID=A0A9P5YRV2_9AGAR|nr:hypothetical protein BDN70DRAFT_297958 [Pholiota conissans]